MDNGTLIITPKVFKDVIKKEFNVGFHIPKKDKYFMRKNLKYDGRGVGFGKLLKSHRKPF